MYKIFINTCLILQEFEQRRTKHLQISESISHIADAICHAQFRRNTAPNAHPGRVRDDVRKLSIVHFNNVDISGTRSGFDYVRYRSSWNIRSDHWTFENDGEPLRWVERAIEISAANERV